MVVSIVVPVYNEAAALPDLLDRVLKLRGPLAEIIVVDGGSTDNTVQLVQAAGLQIITARKGRAWQLNAGAQQAVGDILLFLHADTQLPQNALALVRNSLHGGVCWGRFDVRIAGRPWMLKVVAQMMNWRSRWSGIATGDQAMFMLRSAFETVGGFPEQALMEDIAMSDRLRQLSRPTCLTPHAITSGRRWETRGVWRTIVLMWRLRWAYWRGQHPDQLAKRYL